MQALWIRRVGVPPRRWAVHTFLALLGGAVLGVAALTALDGAGYEQAGTYAATTAVGLFLGAVQQRLLVAAHAPAVSSRPI